MDYAQAAERLKQTARLGWKPGLESVRRLCTLLGNPQDAVPTVHVAGTNGKGSTSAMIASALRAAGYKTGLYTSPHLTDWRDSFEIDGKKITPEEFAHALTEVYVQADAMATEGLVPTEFEILTACAFHWFAQSGCDIAVIETGMGGRLDATNVIAHPLVSVITPISYDHMAYLGDTLTQIAREKCGIIKPGGITVYAPDQPEEAMRVIRESAEKSGNALILPDAGYLSEHHTDFTGTSLIYRGIRTHVRMGGLHQRENAMTAIEALLALRQCGFAMTDEAVAQGISEAYLPARQEILREHPFVMLDGAHNLQGIESLAQTVCGIPNLPLIVVMGMLADKQYAQSIGIMAQLCDRFIATSPDNPRALAPQAVAEVALQSGVDVAAYECIEDAVQDAAAFAGTDGAIVICGSLYMADAARRAVDQYIPVAEQNGI